MIYPAQYLTYSIFYDKICLVIRKFRYKSIQKGKNYVYLQEYGIARDGSNRFFHQSTEAGYIYFALFPQQNEI